MMTKLEEEKLKEEIKGLKANRYFDIAKGIAILIGSVVLFIIIQMPESIINKRLSQESINRERAKLIFELIHNNKDFENVLLELSVIEKAYPENDTIWINNIKNIYKTKFDKKINDDILNNIDTLKNKKTVLIRNELNYLYEQKEKYQTQLVLELSGKGMSRYAGKGPVAKVIQEQIMDVTEQIMRKENELYKLKN